MRSLNNFLNRLGISQSKLSFLSNVSSDIQSQLNAKLSSPSGEYHVNTGMSCAAIQAVIDNASSGNLVVFHAGTYDFSSNMLTLKDGVDLLCLGTVVFSSTNAAATLYVPDNAAVSIKGFPTILNSNGLQYRIVLNNAVTSVVKDFYWEVDFTFTQAETGVPAAQNYYKNTLGGYFTPSRDINANGLYYFTLNNAFGSTPGKTQFFPRQGAFVDDSDTILYYRFYCNNIDKFAAHFHTFELGEGELNSTFRVLLHVFP